MALGRWKKDLFMYFVKDVTGHFGLPAIKNRNIINLLKTTFDCQDGEGGGGSGEI